MLLTVGIVPQLTSAVIERCKEIGIRTVLDFLSIDTESLAQKISITYKDVSNIQRVLLAYYSSFPQSADNMYEELLQSISILNTGDNKLDNFLDGGIYTGEITEISGPCGSGKTQLCFSVLCNLILGTESTVLYFDTNNSFSSQRIKEILLEKSKNYEVTEDAMKRLRVIHVYDVYNFLSILYYIKNKIYKQDESFFHSLKLIVVDSITSLISPHLGNCRFEGHGIMINVSQVLKSLCFEYALSLLVCNNCVREDDSTIKPALGPFWKHVPSVILNITRLENKTETNTHARKLTIIKSCRRSIEDNIILKITQNGITASDL